jgi:hypothetical protein
VRALAGAPKSKSRTAKDQEPQALGDEPPNGGDGLLATTEMGYPLMYRVARWITAVPSPWFADISR